MKLNKIKLLVNPRIFLGRLKGLNPFYLQSAILAKKFNKNRNFRTIIDVGANVGDYSRACKYVFPKSEIHAFEPSPMALKKLRSKRFLKIYEIALNDKNSKVEFNFDENWDSTSSLLNYEREHGRFGANLKKIKVEGKRFDSIDLDIKRPCFAKIEVEGAENKVLKGFGKKLKEVDVLNLTYSFLNKFENQSKLSELTKLTEKAGFTNFVQTYINERKGCELYFFRN